MRNVRATKPPGNILLYEPMGPVFLLTLANSDICLVAIMNDVHVAASSLPIGFTTAGKEASSIEVQVAGAGSP